jgi:hypothetical protein
MKGSKHKRIAHSWSNGFRNTSTGMKQHHDYCYVDFKTPTDEEWAGCMPTTKKK